MPWHIIGGAEINDGVLLDLLSKKYQIEPRQSYFVTFEDIEECDFVIVSNFSRLSDLNKKRVMKKNYMIYEHDHKYLVDRTPKRYPNFIAPKEHIVNLDFYTNAKSVFVQSSFHENIMYVNTELENLYNISGNLWSDESFSIIEKFKKNNKKECYSIMDSVIAYKNTTGAVEYAKNKSINYELIKDIDYVKFLEKISVNEGLIFLPIGPETLSRIVVEARMMGVKVICNNKVGASREKWFRDSPDEIITEMKNVRDRVITKIEELF